MRWLVRLALRAGRHGDALDEIAGDIQVMADATERLSGRRAARRRALALAIRSSADAWQLRITGRVRDGISAETGTGDGLMLSMFRDAAIGLRLLARSPGFAAAAVLMVAFGVGANTAIFSIVNAQLLTPLPYRDAGRIVFVCGWDLEANESRFNLPLPDMLDLRDAGIFADVIAYRYWSASLTGHSMPERLQGYYVTGNTFAMLGIPAAIGRPLVPRDAAQLPARVVVLSHAAWVSHFGADPAIVGQRITLDGQPHEVVGVMPASFEFPVFNFKGDFWAPYVIDEAAARAQRASAPSITVLGRLKDGDSTGAAQAAVTTVMDRLRAEHPDANRNLGASLIQMQELGLEEIRPALIAIMGAVWLVLLLACANLANLLLARGISRRRELAVRAALGAGRGRLIRQLLTESLMLTMIGGLAGALGAWWLLETLRASLPPFIQSVMPNLQELRVSGRALGVALAASVLTGVLAGILPALRASRDAGGDAMRVRDGSSQGSRRAAGALVGLQVALSVLLLCGASLLARSFANITSVDPGFNGRDVLTMSVTLPAARYADAGARRQFYERALERIAALPGVESAAAVNVLPFSTYNRGGDVTLPGAAAPVRTDWRVETPAYLSTIGVPIVRGRGLTAADRAGALPVAVINREFERRYFAGSAPLGTVVRMGDDAFTIVGVAGDILHDSLVDGPSPELHVPFAQQPVGFMMLAIRAPRPLDHVLAVRRAIAETDPQQPVFEVDTLDTLVHRSITPQRQVAGIMTVFAFAAAGLALVGLYALVAYGVRQRTREVGLRLALGATPRLVVAGMMGGAVKLIVVGTVAGVLAALAAGAALDTLLFGLPSIDWMTFAGVPLALIVAAALASYLPARRAARVDPALALRD